MNRIMIMTAVVAIVLTACGGSYTYMDIQTVLLYKPKASIPTNSDMAPTNISEDSRMKSYDSNIGMGGKFPDYEDI